MGDKVTSDDENKAFSTALCGGFAGVGGANRWVLNLFLRTFDVGKRLMDSVFVGR